MPRRFLRSTPTAPSSGEPLGFGAESRKGIVGVKDRKEGIGGNKSGIQSPTSVGSTVRQERLSIKSAGSAVISQVSGRRSLPNPGLLDPERVPDPSLELNQSLFQRFHLGIHHLVLVDNGLDQSRFQGQNWL